MTEAQFIKNYKYLHLSYEVDERTFRVRLINAPKEMQEALETLPELEAKMLMRRAVRDEALLELIKERACIQYSEGLSDSLYITVLRHITHVEETIEYEPADEEYKEFVRKYGNLTEEEIQHKQVPKLKPCTDWDVELKNAAKWIFINPTGERPANDQGTGE